MKITAIPAQVTTVEDRIAGNLNLTQLLLLAVPLFITAVIFFLLPPIGRYSLYKLIISLYISSCSSFMAIRINDKLVIDLLRLRVMFALRPHLYVYRPQEPNPISIEISNPQLLSMKISKKTVNITSKTRANGHRLLKNDRYDVSFKAKDGGLIVKVSPT